MAEQMRIVIAEHPRDPKTWEQLAPVYHLPDGPLLSEAWFQPVRCGGGISLPGWPDKVERSKVCPDCLAGRVTMGR